MLTHTSAKDVAKYLVWLAARECEADPDYLTPLKLQKLLYFVQGWTLAEWGRPMFHEPIEAWRDGPVVPEVIAQYRRAQLKPIVPDDAAEPAALDVQEKALIRSVWDAYKRYSAYGLRDLTHAEPPYLANYKPDREGRCSRIIDTDEIQRSFAGRTAAALQRLGSKRERLLELAKRNARAIAGRDVI
jgi:uncharacterized phage-associated protein